MSRSSANCAPPNVSSVRRFCRSTKSSARSPSTSSSHRYGSSSGASMVGRPSTRMDRTLFARDDREYHSWHAPEVYHLSRFAYPGGPMPTRARLDEFIAAVVSGDHAGAIERYYTEDASMQENAAPAGRPRPFGGAGARHAG